MARGLFSQAGLSSSVCVTPCLKPQGLILQVPLGYQMLPSASGDFAHICSGFSGDSRDLEVGFSDLSADRSAAADNLGGRSGVGRGGAAISRCFVQTRQAARVGQIHPKSMTPRRCPSMLITPLCAAPCPLLSSQLDLEIAFLPTAQRRDGSFVRQRPQN